MVDEHRTSGRKSGEPARFRRPPWLANANAETQQIYQRRSVEAEPHGGTNQNPSKQMRMTDRQRLRLSRDQHTGKGQLRYVLGAFSYV